MVERGQVHKLFGAFGDEIESLELKMWSKDLKEAMRKSTVEKKIREEGEMTSIELAFLKVYHFWVKSNLTKGWPSGCHMDTGKNQSLSKTFHLSNDPKTDILRSS